LFFHPEVMTVVLDKHVNLLERTLIEEQIEAFAGCQLALTVLRVDSALTATESGSGSSLFKLFDNLLHYVVLFTGIRASLNPVLHFF
jgi:hypothetical protein